MTNSIQVHSLKYNDAKTYLAAMAFVAGNILLPRICHMMEFGGPTWLPIYFFTLIGAYKYGWRVGLLTALLSPVANHLLFGSPMSAMLPIILAKSTLLALTAGIVSQHIRTVSILSLLCVVFLYQALGTVAEWAMHGNLLTALANFRMGLPGMAVQVLGGYYVLRAMSNDEQR